MRWGGILGSSLLWVQVAGLGAQQRVFLDVVWELDWELPPMLESPVHAPALLATMSDGSVVTVDYADNSVKRIDRPGEIGWSFGRRGGGPQEFSNPTGLTVGPDDEVYVTDGRNRRVTVLSPDGEFRRAIPIGDVTRVAVMNDGTMLALNALTGPLLFQVGPDGSRLAGWSPPGFDESLEGFAREGVIAGGKWTHTLVVGFLHSGYLVHASRRAGALQGDLLPSVEPFDFGRVVSWATQNGSGVISRVDPKVPDGTGWLDHDSTFFYVGFDGATDHQDRIVDLYCVSDGAYAGSLRAPESVAWGAVFPDRRVAALVYDPIPHLKVWRLKSAGGFGAFSDGQCPS